MSSGMSGRSRIILSDDELSAIMSEAEVGELAWDGSDCCPGAVCARLGEHGFTARADGTVTCFDSLRGTIVSDVSNPNMDAQGPACDPDWRRPESGESALLWMRKAELVG